MSADSNTTISVDKAKRRIFGIDEINDPLGSGVGDGDGDGDGIGFKISKTESEKLCTSFTT